MPASPPLGPSVAGETLGPYRLVRPISAGGMARVYEGRFESLAGVSTRVAIKVIHPDFAAEDGFRDLFIQEARISARLEHLNLVRVQQFNREGELYFLVMEYIEGVTFRKIISAYRDGAAALDAELLAELGRQVCDGLAYAHALVGDHGEPLHLVHRDMKPSNMMLNSQGVAKLLDFGISYAHGSEESTGAVKGTWGYMAPEQAAGAPVGPAADLFGLAAVLYELAAKAPLFPEEDNAVIRRRLAEDEAARRAARLGGEWADLGGLLVRALQRDPAARFRSAAAMGRALGALVPDPMGARDRLVRMVAEIRRGDAAKHANADRAGSSASVSTFAAVGGANVGGAGAAGAPAVAGGPGLPVVAGSMHAPRKPAPVARGSTRRAPAWSGALFSLGFAAVSVVILCFTAWKLFLAPRSAPAPRPAASEVEVASPAVVEPAGVPTATPAAVPAASATSTDTTSAPTAAAPAPVPAKPVAPVPATKVPTSRVEKAPASGRTPATLIGTIDTPASVPTAAAPAAAPAPTVTVSSAVAVATQEGALSLGSTPRAQVTIDGAYVKFTPLLEYSLPAGNHVVLLVTEDGRRKSFRVDVAPGAVTQRVWNFDEATWEDEGR